MLIDQRIASVHVLELSLLIWIHIKDILIYPVIDNLHVHNISLSVTRIPDDEEIYHERLNWTKCKETQNKYLVMNKWRIPTWKITVYGDHTIRVNSSILMTGPYNGRHRRRTSSATIAWMGKCSFKLRPALITVFTGHSVTRFTWKLTFFNQIFGWHVSFA